MVLHRRVGGLSRIRAISHVYFIWKAQFLYIGETQGLPVRRWGEHVLTTGSFSTNLRAIDSELCDSSAPMSFLAYECSKIDVEVPAPQRKLVTQYVEHELHLHAVCDPKIGTEFRLISDTTRTAPTRCLYAWATELARDIFHDAKGQLV